MGCKGGVLRATPKCITVDFGSVLWFKSPGQAQQIREFWYKQGYAEPELLPYKFEGGLIVQRNLEAYGWAVAGDADQQIYEIPF